MKDKLADADELLLATDEDREGEAIAWHLLEVLQAEGAGQADGVPRDHPGGDPAGAGQETRDLDKDLVDAQETRRILDRLYGYEVSPVLWRKVQPRLSAGRVQSVALRLVVERERERIALPGAPSTGRSEALLDPGRFTATLSASTASGSPPAGTSTPRTG